MRSTQKIRRSHLFEIFVRGGCIALPDFREAARVATDKIKKACLSDRGMVIAGATTLAVCLLATRPAGFGGLLAFALTAGGGFGIGLGLAKYLEPEP